MNRIVARTLAVAVVAMLSFSLVGCDDGVSDTGPQGEKPVDPNERPKTPAPTGEGDDLGSMGSSAPR